jgi:hypothetical protein
MATQVVPTLSLIRYPFPALPLIQQRYTPAHQANRRIQQEAGEVTIRLNMEHRKEHMLRYHQVIPPSTLRGHNLGQP